MNKQIVSSNLHSFGLDEIEIKIYLYLLEYGAKTPLEISRETGVNRSKIYRYIDRLKNKKLIEESSSGRGLQLIASNPESLELLIQEKEQQLRTQKELLPGIIKELTVIPNNLQNFFELKYYHGDEGLKQMLWNRLSATKEILLYGYQTMNEIVGKKFAEMLREEQVRRKITVYEIEEEVDQGNFTGNFTYTEIPNIRKYYIPRYVNSKVLKIRQYTSIFNNTVSIINWENDQRIGVEIIDAFYASMQKQLFWGVWDKLTELPKKSTLIKTEKIDK